MSVLVLDTGALVALDRNDRSAWAMLRVASDQERLVEVPAGAIAQAWRDGARQALLARALRHCHEVALDGAQARVVGALCRAAGTNDVIDASVAVIATAAAAEVVSVMTSDPTDIAWLLDAFGASGVHVVPV